MGVEGPVLCVQVPPAAGAAQCLLVPRVLGPSGLLCLKPVSYTQGLNFIKESSTGFLSLASSAHRAPREGSNRVGILQTAPHMRSPHCAPGEKPGDTQVCSCLAAGRSRCACACARVCGCLSSGSVPDKLCDLSLVPSALWASYIVGVGGLPVPFLLQLSGDGCI